MSLDLKVNNMSNYGLEKEMGSVFRCLHSLLSLWHISSRISDTHSQALECQEELRICSSFYVPGFMGEVTTELSIEQHCGLAITLRVDVGLLGKPLVSTILKDTLRE